MMLSRHAEDLFWVGRYLERAEGTVRFLDVTSHTVLERGSHRSADEVWAELLEVLFLDDVFESEGGEIDAGAVTAFLVSDRQNPGSIVSIVASARNNSRAGREWLSSEYWEAINAFHLELRSTDLSGTLDRSPYDLFRRIKTRCQGLTGIADSSMPRTEGYHFQVLGTYLERSLITARMLSVWNRRLGGFQTAAGFAEWVKLLKSLSAYEAYLRDHKAAMEPERVLAFLLQARQLPRSMFFGLDMVERQLQAIARGDYGLDSLRVAGRLRAEVEFAEPARLEPADLATFLVGLEADMLDLTARIERDYFRPKSDAAMHAYEAF